jgi:NADH-quinone oxidoreductase subunit H
LFAECNRTPFDLPESENELIGGYHTEYSSMKLGFYLFAEYINMFIGSAVIVCLYLGGFDVIPFYDEAKWGLSDGLMLLIGIAALFAKVVFFLFLFMWVRWTIPRFRYDQLMNLGWKKLIPLALLNMLLTGAIILYFKTK